MTDKGKKWLLDNVNGDEKKNVVVTHTVGSDVADEFTVDLEKAGLIVE